MFLDDHLRMLPPFGEIWFLDDRFSGNVAAGYKQMVTMGEDGRAKDIINRYPSNKKRDGTRYHLINCDETEDSIVFLSLSYRHTSYYIILIHCLSVFKVSPLTQALTHSP
jgi:hypothetical protein